MDVFTVVDAIVFVSLPVLVSLPGDGLSRSTVLRILSLNQDSDGTDICLVG